jgi:hypothetical protein
VRFERCKASPYSEVAREAPPERDERAHLGDRAGLTLHGPQLEAQTVCKVKGELVARWGQESEFFFVRKRKPGGNFRHSHEAITPPGSR